MKCPKAECIGKYQHFEIQENIGLDLKSVAMKNEKLRMAVEKFKNLIATKEDVTGGIHGVVDAGKLKTNRRKIENLRAKNKRNAQRNLLKTTVETYLRSSGYQSSNDYGPYVLENHNRRSR